jgi:hypothetical protein
MTKFDDWPEWASVVGGGATRAPLGYSRWVWTPTSNRGWYWAVGLFAYVCFFYLVFVRPVTSDAFPAAAILR